MEYRRPSGQPHAPGDSIAGEEQGRIWKFFSVKSLPFWARLALGGIFLIASLDKLYHPAAFAQTIYNYQILPESLINLTAMVLPPLELLLGVFLIFGIWLPGAVFLANGLLIVFWGTLLFNMARGLNVHCGCFSTSSQGDPNTLLYVVRDSAFLLLGAYLFFKVILRGAMLRQKG